MSLCLISVSYQVWFHSPVLRDCFHLSVSSSSQFDISMSSTIKSHFAHPYREGSSHSSFVWDVVQVTRSS
uniref:Uncharacterized protein n=1 Tax=Arion vulgaris TaxID=1028688 RepID=A0A0B7B408_9EUPU